MPTMPGVARPVHLTLMALACTNPIKMHHSHRSLEPKKRLSTWCSCELAVC
jgi:hypothetical protein